MAKQRKHQGLRADGKLRKGFKYSGKRNKNGTAKIVKVLKKKKIMKGGDPRTKTELEAAYEVCRPKRNVGITDPSVCLREGRVLEREAGAKLFKRARIKQSGKKKHHEIDEHEIRCFKWKNNECTRRDLVYPSNDTKLKCSGKGC